MPEIASASPSPIEQKMDRQLLLSLALPPVAAGINTIVGFTVAHWITAVASKRMGYVVSAISLSLCLISAVLAWNVQPRVIDTDDTVPQNGRRLFMVKLALLLAALCAIVVIAGTLVLFTLGPSD